MKHLVAACLLLTGLSIGHAQRGTFISRTPTQQGAFFSSMTIGGDFDNDSFATIEVPDSDKGVFFVSFGLLNQVTMKFTFLAPRSRVFEVRAPEDFSNSSLFFFAAANDSYQSTGETVLPATVEFVRAAGDLPTLAADLNLSGPAGEGFSTITSGGALTPGQVFRFKAVEITTTVPTAYDVSSNTPITEFEIRGTASQSSMGAPLPDPGQWVRIIPDPVLVALKKQWQNRVKKLRRKLRIAKRRDQDQRVKQMKKKIRKLKRRIRQLGV